MEVKTTWVIYLDKLQLKIIKILLMTINSQYCKEFYINWSSKFFFLYL